MELKDVGIKRNSDLVEFGIDEFEHYSSPKKAGRPKKEEIDEETVEEIAEEEEKVT